MIKEELIVYVSSRNNYDMLKGEVLKNINLEGFEFINVDDGSCEEEKQKGQLICEENNIVFLKNKARGVQFATQTLIDFINDNRPNCKWVICFQHDNYPISEKFFDNIKSYISNGSLSKFGIIGFNHLDYWDYTGFSYIRYKLGLKPLGMIGIPHLSYKQNKKWLCKRQYSSLLKNPKWRKPFSVEFPVWPSVGINVSMWNKIIVPTLEYQFHLWLPDIAFQFLKANVENIVIPDLYCFNNQKLKKKYSINVNSALGAKEGNEFHFGEYSNLNAWKKRWGWDFEDPKSTFIPSEKKDTLIDRFYFHDINNGPLKNHSL